uniref:Coiled-coil domain containing 124 n=1 Tax=Bos taurus TaxID=9913 RepID=A0AAF7AIH6_BOVIN
GQGGGGCQEAEGAGRCVLEGRGQTRHEEGAAQEPRAVPGAVEGQQPRTSTLGYTSPRPAGIRAFLGSQRGISPSLCDTQLGTLQQCLPKVCWPIKEPLPQLADGFRPSSGSCRLWNPEEKEKRRLEQLERKKETQRLLEEEDSKLKGGKAPRVAASSKVTRAQIEETLRRDHQHKESPDPAEKAKSHLEVPLEENVNRRVLEEGSVEARTIEDAIAVLSVTEEAVDRHPERRMRAAYTAFEEAQLPRLKQENPNMRLSQLKQMLKKEWLRSPDNPMNQRAVPFNTPK